MKFLVHLFLNFAVACGLSLPLQPKCADTFCTMDLKICPDGRPAPIPLGGCCPSLTACASTFTPVKPVKNCAFVMCTMDFKICPDGKPAPILAGQCCPSLAACASTSILGARNNPLASLGSSNNLLQSLGTLTHGTNLGTALSILNLLNNIHQLSNDIHQIPSVINQTIASIVNSTGQASQVLIDQLIGAASNMGHSNAASRNLLGSLGQNANLLSSVSHLLPQGTSISTVISLLNLLNNINAVNNDIHQIPVVLNETLNNIYAGAGQAGQIVAQQLLGLVGLHSQASNRGLLDSIGQNANLLSSVSHLLPQGTSISTVISLLNLLNNVNALNNDIHQIPAVLQQTLQSVLNTVQNALPPTVQPVQGSS